MTDPHADTSAGESGEWLTIAEACKRLGLKSAAIRSKIRRGTIRIRPAARENDGLTKVWVDTDATGNPGLVIDHSSGTKADTNAGTIADQRAEIARLRDQIAELRHQIGRHEGTETELRARLADLQTERDRLRVDHAAEIARLTSIIERRDEELRRVHLLVQQEQQPVKLLTDQRHQHLEAPKPRWRRWFGH